MLTRFLVALSIAFAVVSPLVIANGSPPAPVLTCADEPYFGERVRRCRDAKGVLFVDRGLFVRDPGELAAAPVQACVTLSDAAQTAIAASPGFVQTNAARAAEAKPRAALSVQEYVEAQFANVRADYVRAGARAAIAPDATGGPLFTDAEIEKLTAGERDALKKIRDAVKAR